MTKLPKAPGSSRGCLSGRWLLALLSLTLIGVGSKALAQTDENNWTTPVNLSHSGAASQPIVVAAPDGRLRIFWWDRFDGLTVADGKKGETADGGEVWSIPRPAPILLPETVLRRGQEETVLKPIEAMPRIVGDTAGRAHAFWLGKPDEDTGAQPLMYSRLGADSMSWAAPVALADSAANLDVMTDASGTLHLVYVRPMQTQRSPTGLYYQRSDNGGTAWSTPVAVYPSQYFRLLPPEGDHLRITGSESENLYVTWDDPRRQRVLLAESTDRGTTWGEPQPLGAADGRSQQSQMIAVPGTPRVLAWQPAGESQGMMAASSTNNAVTLALWDGQRWSNITQLTFRFEDPEVGGQILLNALQVALLPTTSTGGETTEKLVVVGTDQNHEVWITTSKEGALERLLAASSASLSSPPAGEGVGHLEPPVAVNLSRSGAASSPVIVAGMDGMLHAVWQDRFSGFMIADGTILASSVLSGTEEIETVHELWSDPRAVPALVEGTPRIVADQAGRLHAFWLQEPDQETGATPLVYSHLTADRSAWSPPIAVAESVATFDVAADSTGALHLAYINTRQASDFPAGIYYRRTEGDGMNWISPMVLQQSRYLRLLSPEDTHIRLTADDAGSVYVTWDDPSLGRLLLVRSQDGGAIWETPTAVGAPEEHPRRGKLVAVPGGETLLLWEAARAQGTCSLAQAPVSELMGGTSAAGERVLEGLTICPENERFLPLGAGQSLMIAGNGSDALMLAIWDGERWSEPRRLSFGFEDPELGRQVYLSDLQATLARLPSGAAEGMSRQTVVAVGTDQEGDVWSTSSQVGALGILFAPPSPWSSPLSFSQSDMHPGLPAVAADAEGRLHVLWSETRTLGTPGAELFYARWDRSAGLMPEIGQWLRPARVIQSSAGGAEEPDLVAVGDWLHAVWSGGQSGEIYYSRAFAREANTAEGWTEPALLPAPAPIGSWPDIVAGADGVLRVAYAIPVNEGRGIYYTRSDDGGETWSEARQVFDAAKAGWTMADYPRLAMDNQGALHVAWVRAGLPDGGIPEGIYYAQSQDGGETWSEAREVVEGAFAWPQIAADGSGQVHLLWTEASGAYAWWHQWSADGGLEWTAPARVSGFASVAGPTNPLIDPAGTLHLVGLGLDDAGSPALLYSIWDEQHWGKPEVSRLALADVQPGIDATLLPAEGLLEVVFRAKGKGESITAPMGLWQNQRAVPAVSLVQAPTAIPRVTSTPLPTPMPTATPRPTPSFGQAPPPAAGGSSNIPIPLLLAGGVAMLLVAGALGTRLLRAGRQ